MSDAPDMTQRLPTGTAGECPFCITVSMPAVVADDDHARVLICAKCARETADFFGARREREAAAAELIALRAALAAAQIRLNTEQQHRVEAGHATQLAVALVDARAERDSYRADAHGLMDRATAAEARADAADAIILKYAEDRDREKARADALQAEVVALNNDKEWLKKGLALHEARADAAERALRELRVAALAVTNPPSPSDGDEDRDYTDADAALDTLRALTDRLAALASPPVAPTPSEPQSEGVARILTERRRQITAEGWTDRHDDAHYLGGLTAAAGCYAAVARRQVGGKIKRRAEDIGAPSGWPWEQAWWKPSDDPIRNLVKAGALIAAEIDRLVRAAPVAPTEGK